MKTQEQIERKIRDLERKLQKHSLHSIAWYSIYAKIIALDWVLKEDKYMGRKQNE